MEILHELPPEPAPRPKRRGLPLWARIFVGLIAFVVGVLAAGVVTLRIPAVQTWAVGYLSDLAKEKTGFDVRFGGIDLNFYDRITLTDVLALDEEGRRMIEAPEITVDFALSRLLRREVALDNVLAERGHVRIVTSRKTGEVNMTRFVDNLSHWLSPDTTRSKNPPNFWIYSAGVSGFELTIYDERFPVDTATGTFDYRHMHFDGITGILENLRARADTFEMNLLTLRARDTKNDWKLHELTTFFRMSNHTMTLAPFKAWIGESYLADTLQFSYGKKAEMSDFVNKVTLHASLRKSRINYRDLALFAPTLRQMPDSVRVTAARVNGKVGDFIVDRMQAEFGEGSQVIGTVRMQGLPHWDTTRMQIALRPSYVLPEDLKKYLPEPTHPYLDRIGPTDFEGTFIGTQRDFAFNGGIYGQNGTLVTDMRMVLDGPEQSAYSGTFTAQRLDLGRILARKDLVGRLSGKGSVAGTGFTLASARMGVKGSFSELEAYGYNYKNIVSDAELASQKFDGELYVRDTNLIGDLHGLVDLSHPRKVFDVRMHLVRARLMAMGWTKEKMHLHGYARLQGSGRTPDDAEGILRLDSAVVRTKNQVIPIDSLELETHHRGDSTLVRIASDYATGTLEGTYTFSDIAQDLEAALNDYGRLFNNRTALKNRTAVYGPRSYSAALRLTMPDLAPLLRVYAPGLQLARRSQLTADITKNTSLLIQSDLATDYLAYGESVLDAVKVDVATSKLLEGNSVVASASVTSPSQRFGNLVTKDLNLDGIWSDGKIDFTTAIRQYNDSNYVSLGGQLAFEPGRISARLTEADVRLLDSTWYVSPQNRIAYDGRRLEIDSLLVRTTGQDIHVYGVAGPDAADTLHVGVDSLSASFMKAFIEGEYSGRATADMKLAALMSPEATIGARLFVDDFTQNGLALGDIRAQIRPQLADRSLWMQVAVDKDSLPLLRGRGTFRPTSLDNQLDFRFRLTSTPLAYLQPLFTGLASDWQGTATGRLGLTGTLTRPVLTGAAYLRDGGVTVDYLRTRYFFSDSVYLSQGLISVTGATLRDAAGHTGRLTRGNVRHSYFKDFVIDMESDVNGLQLLGTTFKDSKLYYGSAYATGQLAIKGPIGDIGIYATLKTDPGTRLFLPIESALAKNTSQSNYIRFCAPCESDSIRRDSLAAAVSDSLAEARNRVNLTGIRLAFNIEITPDAVGEIIFDRQTGDAVTASGSGRIKLNIDTRGEFTMVGRMDINKGNYHFTFANLIVKDFDILDGSSISWNGDPAAGVLDIKARYAVQVPFSPLLIGYGTTAGNSEFTQDSLEATRRYPANVGLNLTGPLLTPTIATSLEIPNQYPSRLSRYVTALNGLIQTNEQELNKQVFSLLLLRSFSPTGIGTYAAGGYGVGNLSELLSAQLSAWLSEVAQNLEVGVNIGGFNQQQMENFQLRLSYTALNGRLRLTRNGAFTNAASQTTAASVAGDWTLEYNLTQDGKLRLKAFHRTNQTLANVGLGSSQYASTTQGVSVLHTQSFNNLRELLPFLYRTKPVIKEKEISPSIDGGSPTETPLPKLEPQVPAAQSQPEQKLPAAGKPTAVVAPRDKQKEK